MMLPLHSSEHGFDGSLKEQGQQSTTRSMGVVVARVAELTPPQEPAASHELGLPHSEVLPP